ncbi:MAG TPA: molybdate ABC transporter substrate-binding protein [Anaerolineales bacterium]|nr:molybdate ABC transporter substrate-binding protein [Anaerolineales bacterium]
MKARIVFPSLVLFVLFLVGCNPSQTGETPQGTAASAPANPPTAAAVEPRDLTVFAAASLTDAFNEIAEEFEAQNPGAQIVYNFAGSSQLAAQLNEGAVADVFASANAAQMDAAAAADRIAAGSAVPFVSNRLAIIFPADNPAGITAFEDLAQPGVKLILAVPGVPVRDYTDEIVAAMPADFQEQFYNNLVSEEDNVRQVSAKIALGEADAGIVYTSDVTPDIAGQVQKIDIPDGQNVIATYPIAPVSDSPHPDLAQAFINFILSEAGQEILSRWGFGPPPSH